MNNRLQQFLELENITPARLADTLGVQRSGLSHILSGRNKPGFEFLTKLLTKFPHINSEWLLMGKGKPYKEMMASQNGTSPLPSSQKSGYGQNGNSASSDFGQKKYQYDSILYNDIPDNGIHYNNIQDDSVQNNGIQYEDIPRDIATPSGGSMAFFPESPDAQNSHNGTNISGIQGFTPDYTGSEPSENCVNGQTKPFAGKKKRIKRVIVFYSDGSFEELFPHIG